MIDLKTDEGIHVATFLVGVVMGVVISEMAPIVWARVIAPLLRVLV